MSTDYSKMSDDELKKLYAQERAAAKPTAKSVDYSKMSDDELKQQFDSEKDPEGARARRDAVTPEFTIAGGLESLGNFVSEKIDKPVRRFAGIPETGEEFAKKHGIGSDTVLGIPKDKAVATAYEFAASPLNLLPLAGPGMARMVGKGAGAMAGRLAKTAEAARESKIGVADVLMSSIPLITQSLIGVGASPKVTAGAVLTGLAAAAARRHVVPPAATAGAATLNHLSKALGSVTASQLAQVAGTSGGAKAIKALVSGPQPDQGIIARLKRRDQRNTK
jgi:hypothetical protein